VSEASKDTPIKFTIGGQDWTFESAERLLNFRNTEDAKFNWLKQFASYSLGTVFDGFQHKLHDLITRWEKAPLNRKLMKFALNSLQYLISESKQNCHSPIPPNGCS
jgi:hypothetical protein